MQRAARGMLWAAMIAVCGLAVGAGCVAAQTPAPTPAPPAPQAAPETDPRPLVAGSLWSMPEGAVAYWALGKHAFGPGDTDPTRLLLERGLVGLVSRAVVARGGGHAGIVRAVLDPKLLGDAPYRICLMELEATPAPERATRPADAGVGVEKLSAVIEIRRPNGHEAIVAAIQRELEAFEKQRALRGGVAGTERPGGLATVTTYARAGDSAWREVSWCTTDGAFVVGFGRGAIERWLSARAPVDFERGEWELHRSNVLKKRGPSEPIWEAFVDLNALRRALPEEFWRGRLGKLASAWNVANARTLLVSARSAAAVGVASPGAAAETPRLQLEVCWSSRAGKPGLSRTLPIGEATWPKEGVALSRPTGGPWSMLLRVDWEFTLSMVIETYAALADDREATEFAGARKRYEARRGAALQRVARRLEPWALVAAGSDGVVTVRVPVAEPQGVGLTPDIGPGFEGDLRDVLALQADGVVYSVADRTWTLRLDDARGRDRLFPMDFRFTIGSDGRALEGRFIPEKPAR